MSWNISPGLQWLISDAERIAHCIAHDLQDARAFRLTPDDLGGIDSAKQRLNFLKRKLDDIERHAALHELTLAPPTARGHLLQEPSGFFPPDAEAHAPMKRGA